MKSLDYEESIVGDTGSGKPAEGTAGGGTGEGSVKSSGEGVVGEGVERTRPKPKGSSITLWGCGRQDGVDIDNSMSLVVAYRDVVFAVCPKCQG